MENEAKFQCQDYNTYDNPIIALNVVRLNDKLSLVVDFAMIITLCLMVAQGMQANQK